MYHRIVQILVLGVAVSAADFAVGQQFQFVGGDLQIAPQQQLGDAALLHSAAGRIVRGQSCGEMGGCKGAACAGQGCNGCADAACNARADAGCNGCADAGCNGCADAGCNGCADAACNACADNDCCNRCNRNACCCQEAMGSWLDNTVVWMGGDIYKSIGDARLFSYNPLPTASGNSAGLVGGFNTGFGVGDFGVRAQVGASYGAYDFKGRTTVGAPDDSLEQQVFATAGLYKRSDVCCGDRISWGIVYDQFVGHQWGYSADEIQLGQIRGITGFALNQWNEVGVWGTFQVNDDVATFGFPAGAGPLPVHAMNQANAFLRHQWALGGNSMFYLGGFDQADVASWQFGMLNTVPVSSNLSLYGNYNYVAPSSATGLTGVAEEQWHASVGLVLSLGGKAVSRSVSGRRGLPLLPVADNGTFLISN